MTSNEEKHVMLSYNHASKAIVKAIYNYLTAENIPVWFDERDMRGNLYDSMAKAIYDASVVCCFLTPDYEDSRNCKLELEHAQTLGKRIIPCMLTNRKVWKPSKEKGVGIIVGSIIAVDFSDFSETNAATKIKELIDRIKQESSIHSAQSCKVSELIRQIYLRENRLKRMVNEGKSFPIEESYVNLSMVESKEQQEKEKKLKQQDDENCDVKQHTGNIISTYEEIYGTKTSIDVANIFDKCKDQIKNVLVLGRAGIGKSTFCQYITYRWAKGDLWPQYNLIVLIRLRKLTNTCYASGDNYSPFDLVKKEYFPFRDFSNDERQQFEEQFNNGKVLWILDGYDEFVNNIPEKITDVFNYIRTTQHHILTSRPYAIALSYDAKMEITGFTNDNIEKYTEQFFAQIKDEIPNASFESMKLLNFLKSNASIWGVAHIPVNLELICTLWGDKYCSTKKTLTLTMLYENITEWLCQRHLTRQNIDCKTKRKKQIYSLCNKELHFFETLAFNAMEHSDIILPPTLLEKTENETQCFLDDHPQLLEFGVLKSYDDKPTGTHNLEEQHYYFIHLSFQEYFAARHLLQLLKSSEKQKAINFINNQKYNRRFLYVFIFASGLLTQSENQVCMDVFWATIQSEPVDLVGLMHIKLVIECLDELAGQTVFRQSAVYMKSLCHWLDICISTKSTTIINYLLESLTRTNSICNNSILQDKLFQLIDLQKSQTERLTYYILSRLPITEPIPKLISKLTDRLQDEDSNARRFACGALANMAGKGAQHELISTLSNALRDGDWDVRIKACNLLANMGEKAATKEAISSLVNALQDGDSIIRRRSSETLVKMGKNIGTNDVISALMNALHHKSSSIKIGAAEVLGNIGEKAATSEVISALINALGDEYPYVGQSACFALGKMGEKATTKEVTSALIDALRNGHLSIKIGASEALGNLGEKVVNNEMISALINALQHKESNLRTRVFEALLKISEKSATNEVICALINALQSEDSNIRRSACFTLEKMGEKAATNDVISALVNALSDVDSNVRQLACSSLGNMGEKVVNDEVISALINTLRDIDCDVRTGAYKAFVKIGEKSTANEMIFPLINALRDDNANVRRYACSALENMAEKVATNEVICAFIDALRDKDSSVRRSACSALGKMGEKAATNEVISALISALRDVDSDVRAEACSALGKMGKKAATNEVMSALVNVLHDDDPSARARACDSIGNMGTKAATNEVISALITALKDDDSNVKARASEALANMDENAVTNEVISAVISALGDKNSKVKQSAYSTLEKICGKVATGVAISTFINALQGEDSNVRVSACHLLNKMGEKAATNEAISAVINALQDKDSRVRAAACYLLERMGNKLATNEVIFALINTLRDDDSSVRAAASEVLGYMPENVATNEVISALINTLRDKDSSVRRSTCYALVRMNAKSAMDEVISTLIDALRDGDSNDRGSACGLLRRMSETAATNRVISTLINAVRDENWDVRREACEAVQNIICCNRTMKELDSETIRELTICVRECADIQLENVSPDQLMKTYVETENDAWLPLVMFAALLQGVAVIALDNKIRIYRGNDVMDLCFPHQQLMHKFIDAFTNQAMELQENYSVLCET
ncbi:hypothetical protein I4U23_027346 [Adineta vaga]|nr:hypothetical protein I4U23_027346 [Adineta vaga]